MCKVFNIVGSLNDIERHLNYNDLTEFNSVHELIDFQKNYHPNKERIILNHKLLIENEKNSLEKEISELNIKFIEGKQNLILEKQIILEKLDKEIENLPKINSLKPLHIVNDYYRNLSIWLKIWSTQIIFRYKNYRFAKNSDKELSIKNSRFTYVTYNFEQAIEESSIAEINELERKNNVMSIIKNSIYGAIGEYKVFEKLQNLSDEYILINDFDCSFQPPIYNRNENDHIQSIQIDHLLISPSGIFIIETKNWSEQSIANENMRSPVKQVKRTNYALFRILAEESLLFKFRKHNWGNRKIPIRNIIVFINKKPTEEFQYVKILAVNQLLQYIEYFEPIFSNDEVQSIADYLLRISNRKSQSSKLRV